MLCNQHWRILISRSTSNIFRSINLQIKSVKHTEHFLSSQIEGLNVYYYSKHKELRSERLFGKKWNPRLWLDSSFNLTTVYQMGESHSLLLSSYSKPPSFTVFLVFIDLLMSQFTSLNQQEFSFIIFSG